MTCGSHLAAAVSPFERRQGIERKRQVTKYEVPKKIEEKKVLLYIEDDMRVPWASRFFNVSNVSWDRKKKASDQISGAKNNSRKETWLYIEDDMRVPWVSSLLNVSKAAGDQKKKGNSQK